MQLPATSLAASTLRALRKKTNDDNVSFNSKNSPPVPAGGILGRKELEKIELGGRLVRAAAADGVEDGLAARLSRVGQETHSASCKLKLKQGEDFDQAKGEEHDGKGEETVRDLVDDLRLFEGAEHSIECKADRGQLEKGEADNGLQVDLELEVSPKVNLDEVLAWRWRTGWF